MTAFIRLYDTTNAVSSSYAMANTFFNAQALVRQSTFMDSVLRGLAMQTNQAVDNGVTVDLWLSLFK